MDATKETEPLLESEPELIRRALAADSDAAWIVGECAAKWTARYARGRTDSDFAAMINESADTVYRRRRVWETFADVRDHYQNVTWSHFFLALTWDDAAECLAWADENEATGAEMRAWRRMQNGEDLTAEAEELPPPISAPVRKPAPVEPSQPSVRVVPPPGTMATLAAAQAAESKAYAPFKATPTTAAHTAPPAASQRPSSSLATTPPAPLKDVSPLEQCVALVSWKIASIDDVESLLLRIGRLALKSNKPAAERAITQLRRELL